MKTESKAPVFLIRMVRLKADDAAIVSLRMMNYNELSDNNQVYIVPDPNNQSTAILGRSISMTKSGLCVSVWLNTLNILITFPEKTRYEMTEDLKKYEFLDCPNHRDKICTLSLLK